MSNFCRPENPGSSHWLGCACSESAWAEKLAAALSQNSIPEPNTGCLIWTGLTGRRGYGRMRMNGKTHGAHRLAWWLKYGAIPDGLYVMHKCDNPPCIREDHLMLGTHQDNVRDMVMKGRGKNPLADKCSGATHCPRGHEYAGTNLRVGRDGSRDCRACDRERHRASYQPAVFRVQTPPPEAEKRGEG